jgi:hypothetical protein
MDNNNAEIIETLGVILAKMATKDDVESLRVELRSEMHDGFAGLRAEMREGFVDVRSEIKEIRERLDGLESAVKNISGYAKEIDHIIERVSAIEQHLGLGRSIAA